MKKLTTLLIICVVFCALTACKASFSESKFFPEELLSQCKLSDMPVPPGIDGSVGSFASFGNRIYLNLTKDEYEQYTKELIYYLRAKDDIYYLGYSVGSGLIGEMIPYDEIAPLTDGYDIKGDDHHLFFSTEDKLGNSNQLYSPVEIRIIRESGKLKYKSYEYNTEIILCTGALANAVWNLCGAEHTYDIGTEYKIAGSEETLTQYACVHCGSTQMSDFIGDMKTYCITTEDTDADHVILYRPDTAISGVIMRITARQVVGVNLKFTANGTEIIPRETEDNKLSYEFIMPCEDVVIRIESVK